MGVFQDIIQWILNLGSAIFVPLIILVLGLLVGMKFKKAFISAITLGVAFTGMGVIIGFMSNAVSPASEALALNTGISLPALDLGWTGAASIVWSWTFAFTFFAVQIAINVLMLSLNWTKTLNVDMWNVWGKALTGYLVYYVSGQLWAGFLVAAIQVILELKMGDMFQKHIEDLTGIPMVTVTHCMNLSAVFMLPVNKLMDKVPFLNKKADTDALRKKIGIFSENSVMGFIIGVCLGFAGAYTVSMWLHGWDEYNGGNVSYILPENDVEHLKNNSVKKEVSLSDIPSEMVGKYVLITASGSHFRTLKDHVERDTGVIRVTEVGYQVLWGFEEEKRPTSELYMHLLAHAKRLTVDPNHRVVVHNHAPNATAYSLVSPPDDKEYTLPLWRVLTESIVVFPDGVGILPWELPGTLAIAQHSVEKLEHCRIVVWAYHGILATGKDFQDCFGLIETVDKAAKIHLQIMSIKQYPGLSDKDLYEVCQVLKVEPREGFLQI